MINYFIRHWEKSLHSCWRKITGQSSCNSSQANSEAEIAVLVRIRMFAEPHLWTNAVRAYLPVLGSFFRDRGSDGSDYHTPTRSWQQRWESVSGGRRHRLQEGWSHHHSFSWHIGPLRAHLTYTLFPLFSLSPTNYLSEDTMTPGWCCLTDPDLNSSWNCSASVWWIVHYKTVAVLDLIGQFGSPAVLE